LLLDHERAQNWILWHVYKRKNKKCQMGRKELGYTEVCFRQSKTAPSLRLRRPETGPDRLLKEAPNQFDSAY